MALPDAVLTSDLTVLLTVFLTLAAVLLAALLLAIEISLSRGGRPAVSGCPWTANPACCGYALRIRRLRHCDCCQASLKWGLTLRKHRPPR